MNDGTEPGPGRGDEELDDPAVAFGKLTDTIHRLCDEVQVLTRTILADRVQRQEELQEIGRRIQAIQAADPREDLGHVGRELGALRKHIDTLSRQPLLAKGPEHFDAVITQASAREAQQSGAAQRAAVGAMEAATRDLERVTEGARSRKRQRWWVGGASATALVLGFLLYPLAATTLPGGSYLAAAATGQWSRWNAGLQLMEDDHAWGRAVTNFMLRVYNENASTLTSCSDARRQFGRPQACTVRITEPLPQLEPIDLRNVE